MRIIRICVVFMFCFCCVIPLAFSRGAVEQKPIRIGIMPDVDSLPFHVAAAEGLFLAEGVEVELVPFQSPVERDAAFQAGQVDGFVGDTLAAVFLEQAGFDVSITSITNGRYGLSAAPGSDLYQVALLADKEIAVSSNTIIEFIASSLLAADGVPHAQFKTLAIPRIPVRMEMLLGGKVKAACMPEPFHSLALAQGAIPLADSTELSDAPGVMIFSASVVSSRQDALRYLYRAYWDAAQRINANPDSYRDFLVETVGFPAAVRETFQFVTYTKPSVPDQDQVGHVVLWMLEKGLVQQDPGYDVMVDSSIVDWL